MTSLAVKYRPTSFDDFAGQGRVKTVLSLMVDMGTVPTALIFEGPKGSGKTSMARVLASAVTQDDPTLSIIEIDGASNGLVEDVRRLQDTLLFTWAGSRVVIIDEAQSMSRAAFNAMLKILEEPPPSVYFIFVTTEPHKIPPTITSRCITFTFRKVDYLAIVDRVMGVVEQEGITLEKALVDHLADRADGSVRTALMSLDQVHRAGVTTVAEYEALTGEVDFAPTLLWRLTQGDLVGAFDVLGKVLTHNGDTVWIQDQLSATLRDVLILNAGGEIDVKGARLAQRKAVAEKTTSLKAVAGLRILWDAKTKIKSVEDTKIVLDMVVALLSDVLNGKAPH